MLRTLLLPWRERRTWLDLVHVVTSMAMGTATFTVLVVLLVTSGSLLIVFPVALPFIWLTFVAARVLAGIERSRLAATAGLGLPDPVPPLRATGRHPMLWWRRLWERARSTARWKEIGYLLLLFPVGIGLGTLTSVAWSGSVVLVLLPLYLPHLPGDVAHLGPLDVSPGTGAVAAALAGVVGILLVAPWLTRLSGWLQRGLARHLLGPRHDAEHDATVSRLESSRVAAVDTAEAERRRIERDLHDGAQQRLVALAVQLGTAQERLESDPEAGKAMVADAHREAKAALAELRDLVRGIHPVILEDRGLDAALSSVVARAPVPVDLKVDVDVRPPPAVESAAYFIVIEALANVARHAEATRAQVQIARAGDTLVVEVSDDGVGGADPNLGTGLAGLQQRVSGLDGRMHVISPRGGPTTLMVELPCRS